MGRIIRINLLNESVDLELQSFPFSDLQNSFPKLVVLIKRAKAWMVGYRWGLHTPTCLSASSSFRSQPSAWASGSQECDSQLPSARRLEFLRGVSRFGPNPKAWVVENFGFLEITDFGVLYYTTQAYITIGINLITFGSYSTFGCFIYSRFQKLYFTKCFTFSNLH